MSGSKPVFGRNFDIQDVSQTASVFHLIKFMFKTVCSPAELHVSQAMRPAWSIQSIVGQENRIEAGFAVCSSSKSAGHHKYWPVDMLAEHIV